MAALIVMVLIIAWVDSSSRNVVSCGDDEAVDRREIQREQQRAERQHEEDQERRQFWTPSSSSMAPASVK